MPPNGDGGGRDIRRGEGSEKGMEKSPNGNTAEITFSESETGKGSADKDRAIHKDGVGGFLHILESGTSRQVRVPAYLNLAVSVRLVRRDGGKVIQKHLVDGLLHVLES